ncbi:MAG: response regulator transcription factor [Candidatus Gracilibacteria bacterium]|nr:response regulator transcription factor [Candidatus Gracilibacteria bacterium]
MLNILIVEDNKILSDNIAKYLELEGIKSKQLFDGETVIYEIVSNSYDLIILDIGLGKTSGLDVSKKIRDMGNNIPILMLTARTTLQDKKEGFYSGADDYLTKPFDYEELLLRINALIRRNYTVKSENIVINDLEINHDTKKITKKGIELHLSNLEYDLLLYLVHNKTKIITKKELLEKVWGEYDDFSVSRTVDVYVGYLRKKIGKDIIDTVRGQGYIIN